MPAHVLAAAAKCTGSIQQQWNCGWNQPTTTAANAGAFAGHNVVPYALLAGIIIGLLWIFSRAGSGKAATTSN